MNPKAKMLATRNLMVITPPFIFQPSPSYLFLTTFSIHHSKPQSQAPLDFDRFPLRFQQTSLPMFNLRMRQLAKRAFYIASYFHFFSPIVYLETVFENSNIPHFVAFSFQYLSQFFWSHSAFPSLWSISLTISLQRVQT